MKHENYFKSLLVMGEGFYDKGGFFEEIIPRAFCLHDEQTGQSFIVSYVYRKYKETDIENKKEIQNFGKEIPWNNFD